MRHILPTLIVTLLAFSVASAQTPIPKGWEDPLPSGPMNDDYKPTPDSERQEGVPEGKVFNVPMENSNIFPGTKRNISVYVPEQFKGDKPACVYVGLDGLGFRAPIVFDNLIHQGKIPVLIAIGISPGAVSPSEGQDNPRFNRSFEFDGMGDALARFLIEEVFPEVEKQKTPGGLPILISKDPNDRCAGGGSTGGIGSFTLAWERPDQFRRVFSAIGTFISMRGGDRYPPLVRRTETKPIRIFMQDGHHDQLWSEAGDWWIGNIALQRALECSGYDVRHEWGTGPHSGRQGEALFPEAMRWLWRDWPEPVAALPQNNRSDFYNRIVRPEQQWIVAVDSFKDARNLAVNSKGEVFCRDAETGSIYRIENGGKTTEIVKQPGQGGPIAFGSDGKLFAVDTKSKQVFVTNPNDSERKWSKVVEGISATGIAVLPNENLYLTEGDRGVVWLVKPDGGKKEFGGDLKAPTGVAPTPDGLWLAVIESGSHWGQSFRIEQDGSLNHGQRFYWFHTPDQADDLGTGDCCFDREGFCYVSTRLGVVALDRNGRPRLIMPTPVRGGQAQAVAICFGGENFDTLYLIVDGVVYKRLLKVKGAPAWKAPAKLPGWGAG